MLNDYVCPQRLTHQGVLKLRLQNKKGLRHGGYTNRGDFGLKICKDWSLQLVKVRRFKTSATSQWFLVGHEYIDGAYCNATLSLLPTMAYIEHPKTVLKVWNIKHAFLSNNPPFSICGTSTIVYQEVCPSSTLEIPRNNLVFWFCLCAICLYRNFWCPQILHAKVLTHHLFRANLPSFDFSTSIISSTYM